MFNDRLGWAQDRRLSAQEYCKRPMDIDRIKMRLQPIVMEVFARNRQLVVQSPYALPIAQLSNEIPATINANHATWEIFQQPVI